MKTSTRHLVLATITAVFAALTITACTNPTGPLLMCRRSRAMVS